MGSVREKLADEVMPATWAMLEPHALRDALFLIEGVELIDAAAAIAEDDKERVTEWIERGAMRRPSAIELSRWKTAPIAFTALIVQPFVLACAFE